MASTSTTNIRYIPATSLTRFKPRRVAVYARVSREGEQKHHSIKMQTENLKQQVENHPGWIYKGVFIDEGITGTKLERPELNHLIEKARAGEIDIILTKSVSRLGRNHSETLKLIQELRELGVTIIFDNEHFTSMDSNADFRLHCLAIQAEKESKQCSENQLWSLKNRFMQGIPTSTRPYGYIMKDYKFHVVPEEAEVVRMIYDYYLSSLGYGRISKKLNEQGIPSLKGGKWHEMSIRDILTNEKFTGDLLLQKYYTIDHRTKLKKVNKGQKPQILIRDAHEQVITKEQFEAVQKEMKRRAELYGKRDTRNLKTGNRLFSQLLCCGYCGKRFMFKQSRFGNGYVRELWICPDHHHLGNAVCPVKAVRDDILVKTTTEVFNEQGIKIPVNGLTNELLKNHIRRIIVHEGNILEYQLLTGETVMKEWHYESRKKSWTPEMKQKAREKALANRKGDINGTD